MAVAEARIERNVIDLDAYSRTVAGIRIEGVRAGKGIGPNHVLSATHEDFAMSTCEVGFPMRNRTTLGDNQVLLAHVDASAPGSRWCGIDLTTGALFAYGPAAEHAAVNLPGLKFSFVAANIDLIAGVADEAGVALQLPARGEVCELKRPTRAPFFADAIRTLAQATELTERNGSTILPALINALSCETRRTCRAATTGGVDSRHVVHLCVDHAEKTECIPSIPELCLAASVSERRLRNAFHEEFAVPPSQFFREWALTRAHHRLSQNAGNRNATVTQIAASLGFGHLGRFAGDYLKLYGQRPSATLSAGA